MERTQSKLVVGGPGQARQQLADPVRKQILEVAHKAAAGRPSDRLHNPGLQHREIKPQTTD